jgi:pheromone shutdown protein TraB
MQRIAVQNSEYWQKGGRGLNFAVCDWPWHAWICLLNLGVGGGGGARAKKLANWILFTGVFSLISVIVFFLLYT